MSTKTWTACDTCGEPSSVGPTVVEVPAFYINGREVTPAYEARLCAACGAITKTEASPESDA